MARLLRRESRGRAKVYDVTTENHAFVARGQNGQGVVVHNSHQLSTSALDALLKPLEEGLPGSEDKKLVCIFCTTEPEKMRATILSRCAPAFVIQPVPPKEIAELLGRICALEGIEHDPGVLGVIAEITECHIRDALKAVEGVSMLGAINQDNVSAYLHLDLNEAYLHVLECLGQDLPGALQTVRTILEKTSPVTCYARLAETAMLAYQVHLGAVTPPVFWDRDRLSRVGTQHRESLLGFAERFAERPGRSTAAMLFCDLACLHHGGGDIGTRSVVIMAAPSPGNPPLPEQGNPSPAPEGSPPPSAPSPPRASVTQSPMPGRIVPSGKVVCLGGGQVPAKLLDIGGKLSGTHRIPQMGGVVSEDKAIGRNGRQGNSSIGLGDPPSEDMSGSDFCCLLGLRVGELERAAGGPARRPHMDSD